MSSLKGRPRSFAGSALGHYLHDVILLYFSPMRKIAKLDSGSAEGLGGETASAAHCSYV